MTLLAKPYYEDDAVTIYHGDSVELMPYLETSFFDAVITDPPYNEVNRADILNADGSVWSRMDKGGADSLPVDIPTLTAELCRLSRGWVYVWCGWRQVSHIIDAMGDSDIDSVRLGGWHKASPVPMAASKMWLSAFETCVIGRKPKSYFNRYAASPIWFGEKEYATFHPTQKPLWLMTELVTASVPEGGYVIDPFMGSGSVLEAAKKNGRRAVGIEINEEYCAKAAERLSQGVLF